MTLKQGEEAVIVGQSGSGKTTLLRLISGMLLSIGQFADQCDPDHRVRSLLFAPAYSHYADDILFTGSILDNLSCFDSAPDKERVIAACRGGD